MLLQRSTALTCPVTHACCSGKTYERANIEQFLKMRTDNQQPLICPCTRKSTRHAHTLKEMLQPDFRTVSYTLCMLPVKPA